MKAIGIFFKPWVPHLESLPFHVVQHPDKTYFAKLGRIPIVSVTIGTNSQKRKKKSSIHSSKDPLKPCFHCVDILADNNEMFTTSKYLTYTPGESAKYMAQLENHPRCPMYFDYLEGTSMATNCMEQETIPVVFWTTVSVRCSLVLLHKVD